MRTMAEGPDHVHTSRLPEQQADYIEFFYEERRLKQPLVPQWDPFEQARYLRVPLLGLTKAQGLDRLKFIGTDPDAPMELEVVLGLIKSKAWNVLEVRESAVQLLVKKVAAPRSGGSWWCLQGSFPCMTPPYCMGMGAVQCADQGRS